MIRFDFKGEEVSALGMGMMRLPCSGDSDTSVNIPEVCRMIDRAIESGINYFDTAWMYHGGKSEEITGKSLMRHDRKKFLIADKFPGQNTEAVQNVQKTFETQLERCQCGYFDFYLLHNLYEKNLDIYLNDEKYGIISYLLKQKAAGKFRHFGVSCHGTVKTMKKFLDRYAPIMEFCQIQLNYLDWDLQDARAKVELLRDYGIPVWVMEPLRGGVLTKVSPEAETGMQKQRPGVTPHEWSFRFLQTIPEVKVVLSGMSNMEQLEDNIRIFSERRPLSPQEFDFLVETGKQMVHSVGVPCTGCRYCTSKCPRQLDIPFLLSQYNEFSFNKRGWIHKVMLESLPENRRPGACIGCRACETQCPQQIAISEVMKRFIKGI